MRSAVDRIIDANINRLNEGLRVCEDICRFALSDRPGTAGLKSIRHRYTAALKALAGNRSRLVGMRDSLRDVGKRTVRAETSKRDLPAVFSANIRRCQESMRVLEEMAKLGGRTARRSGVIARRFKKMRFELYTIEKALLKKF